MQFFLLFLREGVISQGKGSNARSPGFGSGETAIQSDGLNIIMAYFRESNSVGFSKYFETDKQTFAEPIGSSGESEVAPFAIQPAEFTI